MKSLSKILFLLTAVVFVNPLLSQTVLDDVKKVADKIIDETTFEFKTVLQQKKDGLQIVNLPSVDAASFIYAKSKVSSETSGEVKFGVSSTTPLKIWINGQVVYETEKTPGGFETIAYDMYRFPADFSLNLNQGENEILVRVEAGSYNYFALAPVDAHGMVIEEISFSLPYGFGNEDVNSNWILLGPVKSKFPMKIDEQVTNVGANKVYHSINGVYYNWYLPKTVALLDDVIKENFAFQKHSYFEWHYANGQMLLGMLSFADLSGDTKYYDHVKKFCDFTLANFDYLKYQYDVLNERGGFNHRLFRRIMLDDTGAPALPIIELYSRNDLDNSKFLVDIIANYVFDEQVRLDDGTLCRPEPRVWTVWADDLFMSVPFLLRYAKLTGDQKYYDDAAEQILLFYEKLFDPEINLYYHGWFSDTEQNSVAHWGRANGWVIWAVSEALLHLPKDHPEYDEILKIYQRHVDGLVGYQSDSGLWHQVIDKPESFQETSSSAMFTLGIARGVLNGWLDESYKDYAVKGWQGVSSKIDDDGTVYDICRGTGIGFDLEFYYERERPPHDPRGLGAVLTAGVEVSKLLNENGK